MTRGNLMALGEVLDEGAAGLVVVYASDMADRVAAGVTAPAEPRAGDHDVTAEQLAERIRAVSP